MKNLKTTILKASLIALGLQPIVSNAQWAITGPALANIVYTNNTVGIVGTNVLEFAYGMAGNKETLEKLDMLHLIPLHYAL